ncbi:MAG: ATPase, T2SS/T4P/T4SS family, partial [bacterium]|nr:ATPase, T2SS/T4P/T4SS family [bacterium]
NAALTGHLVFSTLHTNDAAGTFPRLIDLGVNPKIISAAVNLAMAQRLVRKLCSACKKETKIPEHDRARIESALKTLSPSIEVPQREIFWTATGCAECNKTGFKGRTGIYEGILADAALEKIIRENPSEREIQAAAAPQGIPTMLQDGILKVLAGITSLEELERIVDFTN